jgi:predicted PolB exonuclease-like 3'-5' exonuclease
VVEGIGELAGGERTGMAGATPKYLVFDIESVADGELVSKLRYSADNLTAEEAISRYRAELLEKHDSDFIPYTYQVPVSVAIAKVAGDYRLLDLVVLDEPQFRPPVITENFWRGWDAYQRPTFVSFNGRTFDLPLMELAAFRYGISVPRWFNLGARSYEQARNRYNTDSHLDLHDVLTNFGATRFNGGLNLAANLLGKPGKMEVQGCMVQDLYAEGKLKEINDYCRCDVLDTYFVFLRTCVLIGDLHLEQEQSLIKEAKDWLTQRRDQSPAFSAYLDNWGDWPNPWNPTAATDPE